ncbi:MAG: YigZ family protein [Lachnospiraceae bacterium]|nr:YigZ family protein [Lachnospiraceae bacterium]
MNAYIILAEGGTGELVEKKSRFIATLRPVESEAEAVCFIEEMKKKYWDARHNCSAFVIGQKGELTRCSDDGEPSGTAGKPMLEVLLGAEVRNVAVVVTRYFGGTLLGTGGLVRAYSQAVKEGLEHSLLKRMCPGMRVVAETDYNGIGKIQYLLAQNNLEPEHTEYTEKVVMSILLPLEQKDRLIKDMTEATNGKIKITESGMSYYSEVLSYE